ncbi:putative E3 ubiquitin-protein ligase-like isoform X3 [Capsicum annuum]|uniref:putative E3 ubiquitin-protein ligase RF298 isoform X1 n=1 Tax=Capsicum annuum TaxID=4072 RepID=UPI001FB05A70|nr:putative E3 ubiquitin-protein ligase RF298 isoform X1 [Capsicum annuum]KAF3631049.1 putative E3 ubiquitin-protein ligase-like isoform X3 [Capsicum annuum]
MASMVAKACATPSGQYTPAMTVLEKGSRNKRKFRADPPLVDPNKMIVSPQFECTSFEFSADKFGMIPSHELSNGCDMCSLKQDSSESLKLDLGLSCSVGSSEVGPSESKEEVETMEECHDADWSDLTESQLEELVLSNLDTIFKSAIKRIMTFGYSEEIATKAVLRSGICYGCKDIVSNIVENTLAFLRSGLDINSPGDHYFEDLPQMEKYVLAELVCVLLEVRPFFSTGDAMWCLLICDMNVSHACAVESSDPLSSLVGDGIENSSASVQPHLQSAAKSSESNTRIPCKPNPSVACAHCSCETSNVASATSGHSFQLEASSMTGVHEIKRKPSFSLSGIIPEKDSSNSLFDTVDKTFTATRTPNPPTVEEEYVGSRKVSGITKREYILRQKSLHLEKHYRTYGSKGICRKLNGFSGLVFDNKLKSMADSAGMNIKNTSLKVKKISVAGSQDNVRHSISTNNGFSSTSVFGSDNGNGPVLLPNANIPSSSPQVNISPALPAADTELSLSFPANNMTPMPLSYNAGGGVCAFNTIPNEKSIAQWVPQEKKDEMILKLVPRVHELQSQLQDWTEWANQKVMQAARRLSKDKAELKALRQEKEEVERLKKEKQSLEESTMKKLAEMENALFKASGQVERANAAVHRLEIENAVLRREMEAAKLCAAELAVSCQEISKREKKTLMKSQSWEKQKAILQDELIAERGKLVELQQQLEQAKDVLKQLEGKWKQEEKANEDLFRQASSIRKERERIETSARSKEDMIKLKAESSLQKYKDDIERLEKEISQLRLKTDSSKIAALKRGIDGSYASKLTDHKNAPLPKDSQIPYISTLVTDFEEYSQDGGVKRERECVMCLSEEMSVVFLPCAHQVVCMTCNELHEKQGMKECPSCRSLIQQRICVRYARN